MRRKLNQGILHGIFGIGAGALYVLPRGSPISIEPRTLQRRLVPGDRSFYESVEMTVRALKGQPFERRNTCLGAFLSTSKSANALPECMKVDFFIAGVQKGGTTALHSMLQQHPQLQMSTKKEAHFFDRNKTDWDQPSYDQLHRFFDWSKDRLRGEATPIYTFWPDALERLKTYNPDAKIIVLLRHPTFRAHSHWRMAVDRGVEHLTFEDAIGNIGRERAARLEHAKRWFSYVERGFYSHQVSRVFALFPRSNVMLIRTDALWSDPQGMIQAIEDFLGIGRVLRPARQYIVPVAHQHQGGMPSSARAVLDELYLDDMTRTAEITGLYLDDWLLPDYVEPMRTAS